MRDRELNKFADRRDAGNQLAGKLQTYRGKSGVIVLGLPRGGVVVAYEIARNLGLPLDVLMVRKVGVPWQPELAMGAIAEGGAEIFNRAIMSDLGISESAWMNVAEAERCELARREKLYRSGRSIPALSGKTVILVDDGLATGATMRAALKALELQGVQRRVIAVPVAEERVAEEFERVCDEFVCIMRPHALGAIGLWYECFEQVRDEEVMELMESARFPRTPTRRRPYV
ncbi:MAG: phosphoribosyltransferase [Candidatus Omnitrophica bacterium]|nr:phosphoribosyltransferase [Candidatus Omnitrophota bacterium]